MRADQGLEQEQRRHHEEEPGVARWRGSERHVAGRAEAEASPARAPANRVSPTPECGEEDPDPAEQRDQGDHATRRSRWRVGALSTCCSGGQLFV